MAITQSGTSITFNDATVQTTAFTGGGGTVTSVATGNGLSGGTITTSGTLVVACPTFNTVGSYAQVGINVVSSAPVSGSNYSAGGNSNQFQSIIMYQGCPSFGIFKQNNLSGTWKWMGGGYGGAAGDSYAIACRVS